MYKILLSIICGLGVVIIVAVVLLVIVVVSWVFGWDISDFYVI